MKNTTTSWFYPRLQGGTNDCVYTRPSLVTPSFTSKHLMEVLDYEAPLVIGANLSEPHISVVSVPYCLSLCCLLSAELLTVQKWTGLGHRQHYYIILYLHLQCYSVGFNYFSDINPCVHAVQTALVANLSCVCIRDS